MLDAVYQNDSIVRLSGLINLDWLILCLLVSADPDLMSHSMVSDQGYICLITACSIKI